MHRAIPHHSLDEEPVPETSIDDLDLGRIRELFRSKGREIDEKKLLSLGILTTFLDRPVCSAGGLVLFGMPDVRQRWVPDARVSCARFRGNDKCEFIDRFEVEGTLLDAVDAVPKFILRNTRLASEISGAHREGVTEYPTVAIREALINALAHSDYSITGSRIHVAIYNDRMEIQNPGKLPFGGTFDDLKSGVSRLRNRVIARVFNELDLMESWGRGHERIIEACRAGGYPEPKWEELGSSLRVTFYPLKSTSNRLRDH